MGTEGDLSLWQEERVEGVGGGVADSEHRGTHRRLAQRTVTPGRDAETGEDHSDGGSKVWHGVTTAFVI